VGKEFEGLWWKVGTCEGERETKMTSRVRKRGQESEMGVGKGEREVRD
jgi:hypothetical protein